MIKALDWIGGPAGYLKLLDQTRLPHQTRYLICRDAGQVYHAIRTLQVRGAPAIGVAAAFGFYLGARQIKTAHPVVFRQRLQGVARKLISARPTAVNLAWAVNRMMEILRRNVQQSKRALSTVGLRDCWTNNLFRTARQIQREDIETCRRMGRNGARLIKSGIRILTYCNAGALATAGSGTALAVIYQAVKDGRKIHVYIPETRPLLQGARLTAWELQQARIPCTLICDNMIGKLMSEKMVDMVILGADRIAANGDTANKIGTYQVAVLARHHRIPFYVAAPCSTFDDNIRNGRQIPIEYRSPEEVTHLACPIVSTLTARAGQRIAPKGIRAINPAFDVTPAGLITGFITERGIHRHH